MSTKETIGARIRKAREELKMSQDELGKLFGTSAANLSRIESGKYDVSSADLVKLAKILGKPIEWFYSDQATLPERPIEATISELQQSIKKLEVRRIPILGYVPAGKPLSEDENPEGFLPIPKELLGVYQDKPGLFAVIASGDSLKGDDIESGDYLIVDPGQKEIVNGKIYICQIENEVTAKHVYKFDDKVQLVPSNHKYNVIEPEQLIIQGRVIKAVGKTLDL